MDEKQEFFKRLNFSAGNISTVIDDVEVGIYIDDTMANNYYGQVMLETAVNMLARVYTKIFISVPEGRITLQYNEKKVDIGQYILGIARDAREGNQESIQLSQDLHGCTAILSIGGLETQSQCEKTVFITANGWLAGISLYPIELGDNHDRNPVGAIAASCLGVAEIFKIVFQSKTSKQMVPLIDKLIFSALDYKNNNPTPNNPIVTRLDIENAVLFGAGSVGSTILYCMKFLRAIYGTLQIVDTDKEVEARNLLRYGYLTVSDIEKFKGIEKVNWAKEKMRFDCPDLNVDAHVLSVKDYTNRLGAYERVDLAISTVDNIIARRDITDFLAKRTINAGTGDVRFTISRHGFNDGYACLYCNYLNVDSPPANNYQQYAQMTSLPINRIYKLVEENQTLTEDDFNIMFKNGVVQDSMRGIVIGKPLLSFIHERFYGQIQTHQKGGEKVITLAFVTIMAGCLLFGEMLKELLGFSNLWDGTIYEQDMLMLPNEMTQKRTAHTKGLCLCQNSYRRIVYIKKYPEMKAI